MIPSHGLASERLAADRPRELDHPPDRGARGDDVVHGHAPLAVQLELEGRQLDDDVLAGKDARNLRVQLVLGDRGQESDPSEVDPDRRDAGAEQPAEGAQHRAVAAQDEDELCVGEIVRRLVDVVLRQLVLREDEVDARSLGGRRDTLERRADRLGAAVGQHGGAMHRATRLRRRSSRRAHRGGSVRLPGRGGGRTHGCPSGRVARSLRSPRPVLQLPSRAPLPPPRAARAGGRQGRGRRPSAPRRGRPRTAA